METALIIASAVIMPILASAYAMIRKPNWYREIQHPDWLGLNMIALFAGMLAGLIPALYAILQTTAATVPLIQRMYVPECFSVVGWCLASCTMTDFKAKKIDRHMMRPLYTIQIIVSILYCLYMPNGNWVFALVTCLLAFASIAAGYIKIGGRKKPLPGETQEAMEKRLAKKENQPHGVIGASDARLLAVIMASTFPMLTYAIIWPIIGMIILATGTAVYYFAYTGTSITYDKQGRPVVESINESAGAERILANKTTSIGKQRTPQGHSITIPFMIAMFIWLLV